MLVVEDLNAGYGKFSVLYDVNMVARDKEITVIVGPNGSGKSTLLKSIFGLTTIYSGSIRFDGEELTKYPPHMIAKKGIAYLPQTENVFTNLTVRENLIMASYSLKKEEVEDRIEEVVSMFPILKPLIDKRARTLSGGERRTLAIAMSLLRKPKLMMFDEPTTDLAPRIAREILNTIVGLRDELGIAIILVEQSARKALEIGDRAYLLVDGRVNFEGTPEELLNHPRLSRLYLGIETGL
ncbi:MAG TPA: ABC transporter ATP-binding protein [Candidatus Bathyarchaeota archaeon]|nr:ABC transporter ATP-binding protein [Candidatus Bathyarchaeota archaeon]